MKQTLLKRKCLRQTIKYINSLIKIEIKENNEKDLTKCTNNDNKIKEDKYSKRKENILQFKSIHNEIIEDIISEINTKKEENKNDIDGLPISEEAKKKHIDEFRQYYKQIDFNKFFRNNRSENNKVYQKENQDSNSTNEINKNLSNARDFNQPSILNDITFDNKEDENQEVLGAGLYNKYDLDDANNKKKIYKNIREVISQKKYIINKVISLSQINLNKK